MSTLNPEGTGPVITCTDCGLRLGPDSSYTCECGFHCPYCGALYRISPCAHLLADATSADDWSPNEPWEVSPFEPQELPHVRSAGTTRSTWTDAEKANAFGDLIPLLSAWDDTHDVLNDAGEIDEASGLEAPPDERYLFELLRPRLSTPTLDVTYCNSDSMVSEEWTVTYTPQPGECRREIASIIDQLRSGFDRLSGLGIQD